MNQYVVERRGREPIYVTPAQVAAAKLKIERAKGKPVDAAVEAIAHATLRREDA